MVQGLHAAGHRLAVVTAKNEPHARRIVEHLPFGGCFEDVIGATAAEIRDARDQFRAMLKENGPVPTGRFADLALLEPCRKAAKDAKGGKR